MTEQDIRAGRHRVVSLGRDKAAIVEIDGTFTELNQVLVIESPAGERHAQNCAAMLAHCLNGNFSTYDLPLVLAAAS